MRIGLTAMGLLALSLGAAACSPSGERTAAENRAVAPVKAEAPTGPPPAENAVALGDNVQEQATAAPLQPAPGSPPPTAPTAGPTAPLPRLVPPRLDRAKFARWQRRIEALVENAAERDPAEVREDERTYSAERRRCETNACLEASYRRQEAGLMKWDGAEELARQFPR